MKFEENEIRNLLININPLSAETKHKLVITFDRDGCNDNDDVREFRDRVNETIRNGEFTKSSISNPFGAIINKLNEDGIMESKEKELDLKVTIEYTDLINAQFEVKRIIEDIIPLMNKYVITTKSYKSEYTTSKGKEIATGDEFDDIADGSVKELA